MATSRREFFTGVGGIGLGGMLLAAADLKADDTRPQAKPPSSMVFETVFTEGLAQLSYLIGDKATGRAAVIDPRRDVEVYVELARKHKLKITHALETHIHADFVSGCRELADRTVTAKVYLSVEGGARYGFSHEKLKDGDKIDLGRVILTANLNGHRDNLSTRKGTRPEGWHALGSASCLTLPLGPRVLLKLVCSGGDCTLDPHGEVLGHAGVLMLRPDGQRLDPYYLLGVLNSRVFWFFVRQTMPTMGHGRHVLRRVALRRFPVVVSEQTRHVRDRIAEAAGAILAGDGASREGLQAEVERLVVGLYGVTESDLAPAG